MSAPTPPDQRRFYAGSRAVGRFGMRSFEARAMPAPHWHGHVELNLPEGGGMTYDMGGAAVTVPEGRPCLFWAGLPHRLLALHPSGAAPVRLVNLYLPLDAFLFMPHVAPLQVALLSGAVVALDPEDAGSARAHRWYRDYRSGDGARREVLLAELHAAMRRALLGPLEHLRPPSGGGPARRPGQAQVGHVVAMLRHVMENLAEPLPNAAIARAAGLNETYALSLFTGVLGVPMRRFVIRMRLMRARALLAERGATVASVALAAGFASPSQFHAHFRRAYGTTPRAMRGG